jgi:hypothetical protein
MSFVSEKIMSFPERNDGNLRLHHSGETEQINHLLLKAHTVLDLVAFSR